MADSAARDGVGPILWSKPIEPGVGPATLVLLHDGKPIRDFTAADLRFTLTAVKETPYINPKTNRQTSTGVEKIGPIERPWRLRHGRIRIKNIPAGVYYASVEIDRDGHEGAGVGDLAVHEAHVALRTGHGLVRERVRLLQVMALREPRTGAYSRAYRGSLSAPTEQEVGSLPRVPPHVTVAWDPVPGAVWYDLSVTCDNASEPSQHFRMKLAQTSWTADLAQCPLPYPWLVYLSAIGREGYPIGHIRPAAFLIEGTPPSRSTRGLKPAALTLRPTFHGRPLRDIGDDDV